MMSKRKVWFVKHPISQYVEDVKALARKQDLQIIDAKFAPREPDTAKVEVNPPKLTLNAAAKAKAKAKADAAKAK